jgi:hypothetical protein
MGCQEDNSLDGLLRRSLARSAPQEECPGADLLAAYSERTLEENEAARCEKHFSQCSRCREMLAAMVRLSAGAEAPQEALHVMAAAATPARIAVQAAHDEPDRIAGRTGSAAERDKTRPRLLQSWWLAPMAATLLIGVFLYVRHRVATAPALDTSRELAMSRSESGLTDEKKSAPVENRAPATPAPAPAATDSELKKRDEIGSRVEGKSIQNLPSLARNYAAAPAPAPTAGARAGAASATSSSAGRISRAPSHAKVPQGVVSGGAASGAVGGVGAAPPRLSEKGAPSSIPAPSAQTEAVEVQQQAGEFDQSQQQSQQQELQQQRQLTPQDQRVVGPKPKSATSTVTVTSAANTISTIIAIPTPDKNVIYRIVGAGFVELTTDGGATWQGQLVSQKADFTAGSAPTPKICWLVGRGGALFRTSDGSNWKKIRPPASVDLMGVNATDASTVTVTAADGQKYSTDNAGKIWVASR